MTATGDRIPFEGFIRRLLGERRWSPEGRSIMELGLHSGVRTRANWLVPGLGGLAAIGGLFIFRMAAAGEDGTAVAILRVFVFDYMLFLFGWVSGWNMSRRWRENPELIEELSLTPIRPSHTWLAASSGLLGSWVYVLMLVFVAEVIFFFMGKFIQIPSDGGWGAKDAFGLLLDTTIITALALPGLAALALFHFQSVRLAHAMFALGALPRVPLRALALNNFLLIGSYVAVLSVVGSLVTGIVWIPPAMFGGSLGTGSSMFTGKVAIEVSWLLASIPGIAVVGLMKERIAQSYFVQFGRRWAMFGWWGAAELEHPFPYPQTYEAAATSWSLHQVADELNHAEGASQSQRERARREYLRSLSVVNNLRVAMPQPAPIYRRPGDGRTQPPPLRAVAAPPPPGAPGSPAEPGGEA